MDKTLHSITVYCVLLKKWAHPPSLNWRSALWLQLIVHTCYYGICLLNPYLHIYIIKLHILIESEYYFCIYIYILCTSGNIWYTIYIPVLLTTKDQIQNIVIHIYSIRYSWSILNLEKQSDINQYQDNVEAIILGITWNRKSKSFGFWSDSTKSNTYILRRQF